MRGEEEQAVAVAGIIAEYNPFHRGHQWQLSALRGQLGQDTDVVAVMSGNFVQRGDLAILEKTARAEAAIRCGVDLVLELPTPWSCATAERFAQGGVALLAACGVVTHLVFGSECGDLDALWSAARCLDGEEYPLALRRLLATGMTFAAARQAAVEQLTDGGGGCLSQPNDNLAVEYLRALSRLDSAGGLEPVTFRRVGAAHDSAEPGAYASASYIRSLILSGSGDWRASMPEESAAVAAREIAAGRGPVSLAHCERAVLARLRTMEEEDFAPYDGGGEGLYHRFYRAVSEGRNLQEILEGAKTKRYTLARLRRLLLHSYLGVCPAAAVDMPPYLRVLGANERGRKLLRRMATEASLPVVTRPAAARALGPEARSLFDREVRCTDLYTLAYPQLSQSIPGSECMNGQVML